jgi:DNA-binding transcriptional LysR family regulator
MGVPTGEPRMKLISLPPLDALKGFVAAARRGSITAAADDLCLTQSAVSRQIQSLEERFGLPLFVRKHRAIALTETGQQLYRLALPWLEQLAEFAETVRAAPARRSVTITASIGVSALWILPRLGAFQAAHPDIDVRLAATNRMLQLEQDGVDLAIRYCAAERAPREAVRLFDECVLPVASPEVAAQAFGAEGALSGQTLLELDDDKPFLKWSNWLRGHGMAQDKQQRYLHFNQYDQVVQAALEGHGVALGRYALVEPLLRAGRLVARREQAQRVAHYAYWLIDARSAPRAEVTALRDWIMDELPRMGPMPAPVLAR